MLLCPRNLRWIHKTSYPRADPHHSSEKPYHETGHANLPQLQPSSHARLFHLPSRNLALPEGSLMPWEWDLWRPREEKPQEISLGWDSKMTSWTPPSILLSNRELYFPQTAMIKGFEVEKKNILVVLTLMVLTVPVLIVSDQMDCSWNSSQECFFWEEAWIYEIPGFLKAAKGMDLECLRGPTIWGFPFASDFERFLLFCDFAFSPFPQVIFSVCWGDFLCVGCLVEWLRARIERMEDGWRGRWWAVMRLVSCEGGAGRGCLMAGTVMKGELVDEKMEVGCERWWGE